ncbi:hypothetical protein MKW92_022122 [Papaver armeniacum]|nr:hypothetical protein MKW92_015582 [Papaver armeniacum]KAI3948579.1 hypothetical protein MKW92_022122 [Papaver armeniacum]
MSNYRKYKDQALHKDSLKKAAQLLILDEYTCPKNSFKRYAILLRVPNSKDSTIEFIETDAEDVLGTWINGNLGKLNPKVLGFSFRALKFESCISWVQFSTNSSSIMFRLTDNIIPAVVLSVFNMDCIALVGVNVVEKYLKTNLSEYHGIDIVGENICYQIIERPTVSNAKAEKEILESLDARLSLFENKFKKNACNWCCNKLPNDNILFAVLEVYLGLKIYGGDLKA